MDKFYYLISILRSTELPVPISTYTFYMRDKVLDGLLCYYIRFLEINNTKIKI